jgi:hypothetical protein
MKKSLLCIASLAIGSALSAQITITQSDIAPLYSQIRQANDTLPSVTPGSAGANQTWNLSGLHNDREDTLVFTLPQFTPYAADFPNANLAVVNSNNGSPMYIFLVNTPSTLNIEGQAADPFATGNIPLSFDNNEVMLPFPSTYNSSYTDTATTYRQFFVGQNIPPLGYIDSARVHMHVYKTSVMDGWGSCTTPLNTYNTIRQNIKRVEYDTIDIYTSGFWIPEVYTSMDSIRTYAYWANGIGYPVAQLTDYQDLGTISSATWIPALPQVIGMSEYSNGVSMHVYPNPSVETVTFSSNGAKVAVINLTDMNGRIIRSVNVNADQTTMNVSDLASGMYFYQAVDAHGAILDKGKLNVFH